MFDKYNMKIWGSGTAKFSSDLLKVKNHKIDATRFKRKPRERKVNAGNIFMGVLLVLGIFVLGAFLSNKGHGHLGNNSFIHR